MYLFLTMSHMNINDINDYTRLLFIEMNTRLRGLNSFTLFCSKEKSLKGFQLMSSLTSCHANLMAMTVTMSL